MPAPWLLLLDEPSEGIQPSIVQEIGEILAGLRKRDKLSLVVVEQNLDLVLDVADRIVVMERGRIEREVDAHDVRRPAASPSCSAWARCGCARRRRRPLRARAAHVPRRARDRRGARRRAAARRGAVADPPRLARHDSPSRRPQPSPEVNP